MPSHLNKKKSQNDKFYTKKEVVDTCLEVFYKHVSVEDFVIEPSAGDGAFLNSLKHKNKIGYDLEPENEGIIQSNWFDVIPEHGCVILGNPPFGIRNVLTNEFIKHSSKYAKMIAFVLPSVYRKETMQKVFSGDWSLIEDIELPRNGFTLNGEDYHVPCIFQIWKNTKYYECNINLRESVKVKKTTDHFVFSKKENSDIFLFGASPSKIISPQNVGQTNRGYYLSCNNQVSETISNIDWKSVGLSSVNGGVSWFTKQQIIDIYLEEVDKKKIVYE